MVVDVVIVVNPLGLIVVVGVVRTFVNGRKVAVVLVVVGANVDVINEEVVGGKVPKFIAIV